jgi:hypothetical protein
MAIAFNDIPFDVLLDDEGRVPMPVADDTGLDSYTATILFATRSDYTDFRALQSTVTVMPALGGGGVIKVKPGGSGPFVLTFPAGNHADHSRYAVLVGFEGVQFNDRDGFARADVTFYVGDTV